MNAVASAPSVAFPQTQANKLIPIAQTGSKRLPPFMDTPTLKELNIPVEYTLWTTLFAPTGIPAPVLKSITNALREAIQDEQFKTSLIKGNSSLDYVDGEDLSQFWRTETKKLQDTVRQIGKVDE